jgi:hypothetical protein
MNGYFPTSSSCRRFLKFLALSFVAAIRIRRSLLLIYRYRTVQDPSVSAQSQSLLRCAGPRTLAKTRRAYAEHGTLPRKQHMLEAA